MGFVTKAIQYEWGVVKNGAGAGGMADAGSRALMFRACSFMIASFLALSFVRACGACGA